MNSCSLYKAEVFLSLSKSLSCMKHLVGKLQNKHSSKASEQYQHSQFSGKEIHNVIIFEF